jgi:orotidine-5'-phosphate decarboxylase
MMVPKNRIILALDVAGRADALRIVDAAKPHLDAVKINWPLVLGAGPGIITEIAKLSPVICDFKIADIPNTDKLIVEHAMRLGASAVIAHGFTGSDSLKACVDASGGKVFVVTEMSHPGGKEFTQPNAERIAAMAREQGAMGIVAPATRPERIARMREIVGDLKIISPGVGAQGGKASDALRSGADFVIVGRAIYDAEDPAGAAGSISKEISEYLRGREG